MMELGRRNTILDVSFRPEVHCGGALPPPPPQLSPMQVKMSDPQQLAIVPLMSLLAEGEDEAVAYEAVDFGTHLLEGGNALAQGALLQWFQNPDVRLITSMCYKLRKSIQAWGGGSVGCVLPSPAAPSALLSADLGHNCQI